MNTDIFENIPLLEVLDQKTRRELAKQCLIRHYAKNTIIINEGDESSSLYMILDGRVKVYLNDETGKEIILHVESPGGYFGEIALLDDGPRSASTMALEDCRVAVINKAVFKKYMIDYPLLALSMVRGLTTRLRILNENTRSLAFTDVYHRVKRQLMRLAIKRVDGDWIIEERLTYTDLAHRVGASTKSVGRIMQDLIKGGYIRKESRHIIIANNLPHAW